MTRTPLELSLIRVVMALDKIVAAIEEWKDDSTVAAAFNDFDVALKDANRRTAEYNIEAAMRLLEEPAPPAAARQRMETRLRFKLFGVGREQSVDDDELPEFSIVEDNGDATTRRPQTQTRRSIRPIRR